MEDAVAQSNLIKIKNDRTCHQQAQKRVHMGANMPVRRSSCIRD